MNYVALVGVIEVMHILRNIDSYSLDWLDYGTAECPICQQQRAKPSPYYDTIPWNDQLLPGQVDYIGLLPSWRGQCFVLTGIGTYSGHGFTFPAYKSFAKTTIHRITECFILHHGIPHSIAAVQRIHFTAREVKQWAYAHRIHCLTMSPPSWSSWLLKTQLQTALSWVAVPCSAGTRFSIRLYVP